VSNRPIGGDYQTSTIRESKELVMKYICLVYGEEATLNALPQTEVDRLIDEVAANNEELRRSGNLILTEALEQVVAATTIRVRNGKVSVTDGPFAETTEQLGGFVLIEARDLNDAIRIAGTIPGARLGSVEVRPIIDLDRERSPRSPWQPTFVEASTPSTGPSRAGC
jgi:hypothetical protein